MASVKSMKGDGQYSFFPKFDNLAAILIHQPILGKRSRRSTFTGGSGHV